MELKFNINKYYLLAHAFKSNTPPFDGWVNLPNNLWKVSNNAYWFLFNPSMHGRVFAEIDNNNAEDFFINLKDNFKKIFSAAFKSKEFVRLFKETEKYLKFLEGEWENKKEIIIAITEKILGEKLPNIKINVLVTHPNLYNGIVLPESNTICWGHKEDWENYSVVYLMHESLHLILDKKLERSNLTHAIIELISDNELRVRLNKKGKYFKEQKENVGHLFLRELEETMLPFWKKYLKDKNKNIVKFYNEIKNKPEIKKLLGQ